VGSVVKVPQAANPQHLPRLRGGGLCFVLLAIAAMALPARAAAHPENTPAFVNRYITLSPAGNQLGIDVILLFGTVPAEEQRREIDRNGDTFLSDAEVAAEKRRWSERGRDLLTLTVDGRPTSFTFTAQVDLNGRMGVNSEPMLVQLHGQIPLGEGAHKLIVEAGPDLPRMGETEIVLDPGHPWLLQAGISETGQDVPPEPTIKYPGPRAQPSERRHGGFVIRSHGALNERAPSPNLTLPALLVAFSIVLGVVLMWLVRRADRNRRSR
jgi:hypothetical protein